MKTVTAYARDIWEVQKNLTDRGFKIAAELLGDMPRAQAEAIIGAAFTLQHHRDTWRGGSQETSLWQKIRVIELGMTVEELARAVGEFHAKDVAAQEKAWRQKCEEWAKAQMQPHEYDVYKLSSGGWDIEQRFARQCPRPRPQVIKKDDVAWVENQRPHRENFNPVLIEIFERYFQSVTGYALRWEQLHSRLESRDPRAKLTPESQKKKNQPKNERSRAA